VIVMMSKKKLRIHISSISERLHRSSDVAFFRRDIVPPDTNCEI